MCVTFLMYYEPTGYFTFYIKSLGLPRLFPMKPPDLAIQYGKSAILMIFLSHFKKPNPLLSLQIQLTMPSGKSGLQ